MSHMRYVAVTIDCRKLEIWEFTWAPVTQNSYKSSRKMVNWFRILNRKIQRHKNIQYVSPETCFLFCMRKIMLKLWRIMQEKKKWSKENKWRHLFIYFYNCTVHFDVIKSLICPTNAHLNSFKMLKFTLKFTINAPTCFGLTKPSSGSLRCVLR